MKQQFKISVITICFNALRDIERTIKSVLDQTYTNIEYIIIDGGSSDGTIDVIKKYAEGRGDLNNSISLWISEPDSGIYDAMNKGLSRSTGDYITFLNAGDYYYDSTSIEQITNKISEDIDIIYGNVLYETDDYKYWRNCLPIHFMSKFMIPPHPTSFIKRSYHVLHPYDTSFKSSADYNFFYNAYYLHNCKFYFVPQLITVFDNRSGMSKDNYGIVLKENLKIQGKTSILDFVKYFILYSLNSVKAIIKLPIPTKLLKRIHKRNLISHGYQVTDNQSKI